MGGDNLTINGHNFGRRGALAFINGLYCKSIQYGVDARQNSSNASAVYHRKIICKTPALAVLQPQHNGLVVIQSNQFSEVYRGFKYLSCGANEYQIHITEMKGDKLDYFTCARCAPGKHSSGTDAKLCIRCEGFYLGAFWGHCEVPVFAMCLGVTFLTFAGLVYRVLRTHRLLAQEIVSRLENLNIKQEFDMELMAAAWKFEWHELELKEQLGAGAAGEVWRAMLKGQYAVAVKKMYNSQDVDVDADAEIRFLKRARHPRLVLFLGCGRMDSGDLFLVLEYCSEGDLHKFLHRISKDPEWSTRVDLLVDVVQGLMCLHLQHGAIHRDLKSDNVLLTLESDCLRAKITDFGQSKRIGDHAQAKQRPGATKTAQRVSRLNRAASRIPRLESTMTSCAGSLLWMAPECIPGVQVQKTIRYGQPADIYAFGMVMYEVLELKRPWFHLHASFSAPVINAVLAGERPQMSPCSRKRKEYVCLMERCWAPHPAMRPDVVDLARDLEGIKLENEIKFGETRNKRKMPWVLWPHSGNLRKAHELSKKVSQSDKPRQLIFGFPWRSASSNESGVVRRNYSSTNIPRFDGFGSLSVPLLANESPKMRKGDNPLSTLLLTSTSK